MMLLKKACNCDSADALNTIGMILNEEKRYEESFPYHKRSAEKGDMYGLHNLGNAYFYARGVERDVKKAFDLWTEASDKGNPDSSAGILYGLVYLIGFWMICRHYAMPLENAFDLCYHELIVLASDWHTTYNNVN